MRPEIKDGTANKIYNVVGYPPSTKFEDALSKLIAMAEGKEKVRS